MTRQIELSKAEIKEALLLKAKRLRLHDARSAAGKKGAEVLKTYGHAWRQRTTLKAGLVTWLKYGSEHMSKLGKKGQPIGAVTVKKNREAKKAASVQAQQKQGK